MEKVNGKAAEQELVNEAVGEQNMDQAPESEVQAADNVAEAAEALGDKSAQLATALKEWEDKYLRLVAEFDNYRKRTLREKMELVANGGEEVICALLGVLDDIDRALAATEQATDVEAMKEGVSLIHQKLMDVLHSRGLQEIEAVGCPLDTDLHEAVAKIPVEDKKQKDKIVDVVQKGYKLKDKVARHAKVVVGE